MTSKKVVIKNKSGIHARPAAMIVEIAAQFSCDIYLRRGEDHINAKSILGVIALGASYMNSVIIEAEGPDEKEALEALSECLSKKISEE